MNKLAILRHGSYGLDDRIDITGQLQSKARALELKGFLIDGETSIVLSSTAPRALDTSKIVSFYVGAPIEEYEQLWSDNRHPENLEAAYQLVESIRRRADLGILVTHLEYAQLLPSYVGEREGLIVPPLDIQKGEGVFLDYVTKTYTLLR